MSARRVLVAVIACLGMATCLSLTRRIIWPPPLLFHGHAGKVYSVVPSPDGKTLASTSADKTLRLWDVATGRELAVFRGNHPAFSPDGKTLASTMEDRTIQFWDVATGKERACVSEDACGVAFSPDGQTLAIGSDTAVTLWDIIAGKGRVTCREQDKWIRQIMFSPDGRTLASVYGDLDGKVRLWDATTGNERATLRADSGQVECIAISPDSKTLAAGDSVGAVKLWDVATGTNTATFKVDADEMANLAFSPDGKTVASLDSCDEIKLWDVASGRNTATFNKSGPWVKFSRRPRLFHFIGDVLDAHPGITNALPGTGAQPKDVPLSLAFTPTGTLLAFGSDGRDETAVKVWRVTTVPVGGK